MGEAVCPTNAFVGGVSTLCPREESQRRCFVAAPDQEVASACPPPTFPPDEITSQQGNRPPL